MKLLVLHSDNPSSMLRALQKGHISKSESARLYGQILLHLNSGSANKATAAAEQLLAIQPHNNSAKLAAARVALETRDYDRAESLLTSVTDIHPDYYAATDTLVDTLIKQRKTKQAELAIRQYLRSTSQPVSAVYRKYAQVLQQNNQLTAAHEAMADYYFSLDEARVAMGQLELALKSADEDSTASSRVNARLQEVRRALVK